MSQADLDINRGVRSILVRHWIDLGRLSVRSTDGKVYVRGALVRIGGITEELSSAVVEAIFTDIKKVREVRQVYPSLENWTNDSGSWQPVGKSEQKVEQQQTGQSAAKVYDIEKGEQQKKI